MWEAINRIKTEKKKKIPSRLKDDKLYRKQKKTGYEASGNRELQFSIGGVGRH